MCKCVGVSDSTDSKNTIKMCYFFCWNNNKILEHDNLVGLTCNVTGRGQTSATEYDAEETRRVDETFCRFPQWLSTTLTGKREHDTRSSLLRPRCTFLQNRIVTTTMTDTRRRRVTFYYTRQSNFSRTSWHGIVRQLLRVMPDPNGFMLVLYHNTMIVLQHLDFT